MPTMPEAYYNRFDPAKKFEAHLFRAGFAVQNAEFNEVQSHFADRIQGVADALFRDGDVIRDARVIIDVDPNAPYPPEHHLPLDVSRLEALGWRPQVGLEDMYRKLIAYMG